MYLANAIPLEIIYYTKIESYIISDIPYLASKALKI